MLVKTSLKFQLYSRMLAKSADLQKSHTLLTAVRFQQQKLHTHNIYCIYCLVQYTNIYVYTHVQYFILLHLRLPPDIEYATLQGMEKEVNKACQNFPGTHAWFTTNKKTL
jgi:hypothetical protein